AGGGGGGHRLGFRGQRGHGAVSRAGTPRRGHGAPVLALVRALPRAVRALAIRLPRRPHRRPGPDLGQASRPAVRHALHLGHHGRPGPRPAPRRRLRRPRDRRRHRAQKTLALLPPRALLLLEEAAAPCAGHARPEDLARQRPGRGRGRARAALPQRSLRAGARGRSCERARESRASAGG
ncbi:hypothetical protein H632_c5520p0, partial [Helicosporidium sp. ATCC 50920]